MPSPIPAIAAVAAPAARHSSPSSNTTTGSPTTTDNAPTGRAANQIQPSARRNAARNRLLSPEIREKAGNSTWEQIGMTASDWQRGDAVGVPVLAQVCGSETTADDHLLEHLTRTLERGRRATAVTRTRPSHARCGTRTDHGTGAISPSTSSAPPQWWLMRTIR